MTVGIWEHSSDLNDTGSCQFFLRIENFPMSASPKDVKAFFCGLDILPGGISILGKNAFVSFERLQDMSSAMLKDGHVFHEQKLFLSIVSLKELQKINDLHIQRRLPFLPLIGEPSKDVTENSLKLLDKHRKIRPTTLMRNSNHHAPDAAFVPKEIDSPTKGFGTACSMLGAEQFKHGRKRIKPTPVKYHKIDIQTRSRNLRLL